MKIKKQLLQELISGFHDCDRFEIVYDEICDTGRWSIHRECVIKDLTSGRFYDASYSEGATEMQDEEPFEYADTDENGDIGLREVFPYEETVVRYRAKDE